MKLNGLALSIGALECRRGPGENVASRPEIPTCQRPVRCAPEHVNVVKDCPSYGELCREAVSCPGWLVRLFLEKSIAGANSENAASRYPSPRPSSGRKPAGPLAASSQPNRAN